jgi:hypothetical protein
MHCAAAAAPSPSVKLRVNKGAGKLAAWIALSGDLDQLEPVRGAVAVTTLDQQPGATLETWKIRLNE